LAKDWQWQRSTVRTFLNSLVALGYLKMTPCGKHCIFTMRI
jgi:DNA-binding IclR family transcriptional regulator